MAEIMLKNMLSIDVEDYYHVSAFEKISLPSTWKDRESRVERNTDLILEILDESSVKATFFILGWVAENIPDLVKAIFEAGHEVASHGYMHQRVANQKRSIFRNDIRRSKAILEDLTCSEVIGYRAPSYSITRETDWAFDELYDAGYLYDSSIFPVRHDFYGIPDWPRFCGYAVKTETGWQSKVAVGKSDKFIREVPITTLRLGKKNLPIAGGGYFRLFPYAMTSWGLQHINKQEKRPFVFYLHPWEFDPLQPRMAGCSFKSKIRHYLNLSRTESKFVSLLREFRFTTIKQALLSMEI